MSRCTIRLAWAWAIAVKTSRKRRSARFDAEGVGIAVAVDLLAFDVFQDQIRLAGRRHPGVDEMRDVRMSEAGQDAALAPEAPFAGVPDEAGVEKLHGGPSLEAAIAPPGEPHAAHPSLPDDRDERVGADRLASQPGAWGWQGCAAFEETLLAERSALGEERQKVGGQLRVLRFQRFEPRDALVPGQLERVIQIRPEGLPTLSAQRRHGLYVRSHVRLTSRIVPWR